ncbi:MAG: PLDc N-terminal domain-containing protein [Gemmatimonadaceae bacterium]|nr:PLDc N-terminal domain-containing protein [Gemmatimonadaceae bacterium]MDQ3517922.1 PLDc N-terminal domain-containing protein [Gemmatimonadota bacterium]
MIQVPPGQSILAGSRSWPIWFFLFAVMLFAGALLSIWLGKQHSVKAKVIWTAIAFAVPIIGPLSWFALGRERRR